MKNSEKEEKEKAITEAEIKAFFQCPYSYYLKKHVGLEKIPRNGFGALALFFGQARAELFKVRDQKTGRIFPFQNRAGPELKLAEEMNKEELRKYLKSSSPEKFGGALYGKWLSLAKREEYAGSKLVWNFEGQSHYNANQIKEGGKSYYEFILKEGAPFTDFTNKRLKFKFKGNWFEVKIPEIREGMRIDDPTLWGFNMDFPTEEDHKRNDLQASQLVTLRILGFGFNVHKLGYRQAWGIDEGIAERLGGNPNYLDERIIYRHFKAMTGESQETRRREEDLSSLERTIELFLEKTSKEEFTFNHGHCPSCQYNLLGKDGKPICRETRKGVKPAVPAYYFRKKKFVIEAKEEEDRIKLKGKIGKEGINPKEVCSYDISLRQTEEGIEASSRYTSYAYGHGFEEKMIEEADKQLQERADKGKKIITHEINFRENFGFAGQEKIRETLERLGYQNSQKKYEPKNS